MCACVRACVRAERSPEYSHTTTENLITVAHKEEALARRQVMCYSEGRLVGPG